MYCVVYFMLHSQVQMRKHNCFRSMQLPSAAMPYGKRNETEAAAYAQMRDVCLLCFTLFFTANITDGIE